MATQRDSVTLPIGLAPVPDPSPLAALLQYEAGVRRQDSVAELIYHTANETRRIVHYDQMFVMRQVRMGDGFQVVGTSSLAVVDRNAPLIQAVERAISIRCRDAGLHEAYDFEGKTLGDDPAIIEYPFSSWYWQPMIDREGMAFAAMLIVRDTGLSNGEAFRLNRVAETTAHSWRALTRDKPVSRLRKPLRNEKRALAVLLIIGLLWPVRMTAIAPAEIVPTRPYVLAAPFAGVISRILVAPNAQVKAGQPLFSFDDVKLRNEMAVATERLGIARTRVEQSTSATFGEASQSREISIMRAEYDLALAEYNYAREVLAKSLVTAPRAGMVIYGDRRDWEGRAVNVGDPVMQVADPRAVDIRIDLPAAEQMALKPGDDVRVWLDAQPLWAIDARIETASYQARPTANGILAFAVTAKSIGTPPRIGSRGSAKLYGQWVPFIYSILKRPISSVRQYIGL